MPLIIRTLSDRIFDLVRQKIVMHEIRPGAPIRQELLAAEFGTSRIPLREALARLEGVGLAQATANRGYLAKPLSHDEVEDIFALRNLIEPSLAAAAALNASDTEHSRIVAEVDHLKVSKSLKATIDGRRTAMLSMLVRPDRPIATSTVVQLFDRSERYHPDGPDSDFLDHRGLRVLVEAWISKDTDQIKHLWTERLNRRAELARDCVAAFS